MSEETDRLRGHVASYNSMSSHRQNCLDVCDEVDHLTTEGTKKDDALVLAWDALRWADSPDESDPCDQWTEIPRDRAQKAFEAVWNALGQEVPSVADEQSPIIDAFSELVGSLDQDLIEDALDSEDQCQNHKVEPHYRDGKLVTDRCGECGEPVENRQETK